MDRLRVVLGVNLIILASSIYSFFLLAMYVGGIR